ncbi:hypothetical protein S40288_11719 [Stachybotrys chartarum IBT 40288]|nr:hypothetical protein S40288_11719 [Stachybotrys chartarum IBT 40288]
MKFSLLFAFAPLFLSVRGQPFPSGVKFRVYPNIETCQAGDGYIGSTLGWTDEVGECFRVLGTVYWIAALSSAPPGYGYAASIMQGFPQIHVLVVVK